MHTYLTTLLLPILLLSQSAFSYPGHREPEFKLHNILFNSSYIFSTPAHYATGEGLLSFDLTNPAVEYTTHCSATSIREFDFFYGDTIYTCDPVPNVVGSTNFTFSTSGAMAVNQTWTCDEEGGHHGHHGKAETFLGYGTGTAKLDCNRTVDYTPNWTIGQIYSVTSVVCKPADLTIVPTIVKV